MTVAKNDMNKISTDSIEVLETIRDFVRWGASQFNQERLSFGHGTANALDEAYAIVLHELKLPNDLSADYLDAKLTQVERLQLARQFERRIDERIPAAYLTNEAMFAGLAFYVDERVLIPRSPIAELIQVSYSPWIEPEEVTQVLDLCTGSGCIAITSAYCLPEALVDAVDVSEEALAVAEINIKKHDLSESVNLIRSDLFDELVDKRYDIIVSNPPYVSQEEWRGLPVEYHKEPKLGFDGGVSGLDLVVRILSEAHRYLTPQGILIIETGSSSEPLQVMFSDVPFYWLDFEYGGDGVLLLTADQVNQYTETFKSKLP